MSLRESRAAENYQAFNLLRSRFGGLNKPPPPPCKEKRKRRDPRFDAPPLKPLVEENDITSVPQTSNTMEKNETKESDGFGNRYTPTSPLKNSTTIAASSPCAEFTLVPVLNDVEISSQTSHSSAYYSLSSTLGSVTELSDTASTDSFNEYDIKTGVHTAHLFKSLEHSPRNMTRHQSTGLIRNRHPLKYKRPSSAGVERTSSYQTASEPPLSVPKVSSLENILESCSKISLYSTESDNSDYLWSGSYGRFVSSQPTVASLSHKVIPQEEQESESTSAGGDVITPHASQDNDSTTSSDEVGIVSRRVSIRDIHSPKFPNFIVVEEKNIEERHPQTIEIKPLTSSDCAWTRAQQKYKSMKQNKENMKQTNTTASTSQLGLTQSTDVLTEISSSSIVEERARVFGGVKKRGTLRRTQSFQIGQRHFVSITTDGV